MIGQQLAHFRITEKLGAGGMGIVYRAHDHQLDRDVAVKVLPAGSIRDPNARARLLREARTASKLNHPNVCTIYEVGEAGGHAYIAMELVEGESLKARLAGGALPAEEVLRLGLQLADALAHAHERGVVHRDLKCANVMLTPEGRAKILDFGLAKRLGGEGSAEATTQSLTVTEAGAIVGTLAYMAPEQLRGEHADARSDLWALGVVLYETASGRRPFQGQSGFELSSAILRDPAAPLPGQVPAALRSVIGLLLAKEPGQRYQRARDVISALEAVQPGVTAACAPPGPRRVRPQERRTPRKRIRALAVLPLTNLSRDPEQEFFADGMTDALISDLAKLRALKVISRTSAMRYKGTGKSLPEIAGELNVDAVIEGSVLRVGQRVRITAQLIHAATDTHLWAESYERDLQDVLLLQSEVARTIAGEIRLAVTPEEAARLARVRAVNPEAYEACLKGRFHWYKLSPEHLDTALEYFQLALEKDPNFAPAYAGIADIWGAQGDTGLVPRAEVLPRVKAAASRAIELDDTLAQAHVASANVRFIFEWDWNGAEREFRRALQLDPSDAAAHFFYSDFLISMQRQEEWEREIRRTLELDPLNFFYQCFFGWHLVYARRCDEAIAQLRKTLCLEPNFSSAHLGLWGAFFRKRMDEEALAEARKFFAVLRDNEIVEALDHGHAEAGYTGAMSAAAHTLAARSESAHVPAFRIARLYAHAEDKDQTLAWLEKAYEQRETPLVHLSAGWDWDSVRSEPRFQELLRRMRLPA